VKKHYIFFSLLGLAVIPILLFKSTSEEEKVTHSKWQRPPLDRQNILLDYSPNKSNKKRMSEKKTRKPAALAPQKSFASKFEPHPDFKLKGYTIAKDLGVMPKKRYNSGLGELIFDDGKNIFYRRREKDPSTLVAFSAGRNKFFPLSTILNLKGIDQEERQQLKNQGFEEYHYIPALKIMFIKTAQGELEKTYHELGSKGLQVQLEVLDERPRPH
jgi:hypothetical protein